MSTCNKPILCFGLGSDQAPKPPSSADSATGSSGAAGGARSSPCPAAAARAHAVTSFARDEAGEIAPASYFFAFMLTLALIFFVVDLGMRKGARVAVEYAAYCAARAAATQLPSTEAARNQAGACLDATEKEAIEHAAAACLSSVASKRGVLLSLQLPGMISRLVKNTQKHVRVELMDAQLKPKTCFGHNEVVTAVVHYQHTLLFPLSPLSYLSPRGLEMTAYAQHMVHTIK